MEFFMNKNTTIKRLIKPLNLILFLLGASVSNITVGMQGKTGSVPVSLEASSVSSSSASAQAKPQTPKNKRKATIGESTIQPSSSSTASTSTSKKRKKSTQSPFDRQAKTRQENIASPISSSAATSNMLLLSGATGLNKDTMNGKQNEEYRNNYLQQIDTSESSDLDSYLLIDDEDDADESFASVGAGASAPINDGTISHEDYAKQFEEQEKEASFLLDQLAKKAASKANATGTTNLKTTLDTVPQLPRFQCLQCQKNYSYRNSLISHIKDKHTEESRFRCDLPECNAEFTSKKSLRYHITLHDDYDDPQNIKNPKLMCTPCKLYFKNHNACTKHKNSTCIHRNTSSASAHMLYVAQIIDPAITVRAAIIASALTR